jgi:ubiquinone/menaquinone biosynthesis C-methylase UbiE
VNAPDITMIKTGMKATWMTGDFGQVAKYLEPTAAAFVRRRNVKPGMLVLDVACGTGNAAIPAAKAGARVSGVDIATNLLASARLRAQREGLREGLDIEFDEGDAEELPFADRSFDLVVSMFGAIFAPRPERAAAELTRVCRPGGQIAMANWTPRGFIGEQQAIVARYQPVPPGMPNPIEWGAEATVRRRFAAGVKDLRITPVMATMKFPFSAAATVEFFRTHFGPAMRTFAALPADQGAALRRDMEDLYARHNQATDGATHVEAEYLEVVATRA